MDVSTSLGGMWAISATSTGTYGTTATATVTNLTATIISQGRPVRIDFVSGGTGLSLLQVQNIATQNSTATFQISRNGTSLYTTTLRTEASTGGGSTSGLTVPLGLLNYVDYVAPAGTNVYTVEITAVGTNTQVSVWHAKMFLSTT